MMARTDEGSTARRFLHCNLNCADVARASGFFEGALDLRVVMRSGPDPTDGTMLGIDGTMSSVVWFVYDERGPRVTSSIELQQWEIPSLFGEPHSHPACVGAQALGFLVPDAEAAGRRVAEAGGRRVSALEADAAPPGVGRVVTRATSTASHSTSSSPTSCTSARRCVRSA